MTASLPTRRTVLEMGSLAVLSAVASSCAGRAPARTGWTVGPRRRFAPVRVAPDRVIRTVAGLRPFRPSGFVVRAVRYDDRTVVHNYGHGGGGITLSWGTAHLAVEEALGTGAAACAVIGCGAVGLATARLLQRRGRSVTIYARDLPPETTSNVAGGQWSPFSVFDQAAVTPAFEAQFRRAARLAYREFQELIGEPYGVRWVENYFLGDAPVRLPPFVADLRDLYPDVRQVEPAEHPFGTRYATRLTTMLVEPAVYLQAMLRDFLVAGGRLVVRTFGDLGSVLALAERTIVNCAGLGAGSLFEDRELIPVKGQLTVLLPQPEVDYIVIGEGGLYMMPRRDGVLLGGTFERGEWSLEPNPEAARRIMDGHRRLFGS